MEGSWYDYGLHAKCHINECDNVRSRPKRYHELRGVCRHDGHLNVSFSLRIAAWRRRAMAMAVTVATVIY